MITNDYIQGYIAALKTCQDMAEHTVRVCVDLEENGEACVGSETAQSIVVGIQDLHQSYRQLVDNLNKGIKK